MKKTDDRRHRIKDKKRLATADNSDMDKMYNIYMTYDAETLKRMIGSRLSELRMMRKVSAREMSISLGHGAGYINSIENGSSWPSLEMVFEICDYLKVSPKEFFDFTEPECGRLFELKLVDVYKSLGTEEKEILRRIIDLLERKGCK
jgi:transcriptional regulator with XRE-family HTH domain